MKQILSLILLTALVTTANATVTDSLFAKGNEYYLQRQYAEAGQCYSRIVALGYESADLYYNLGNAYYKQDKFANAILYYEKALQLKPGDDDIKQNLALANSRIVDKIDVIPEFFVKRWIKGIRGIFSPDQWSVLSLVLFILSLAGFVVFYISRHFGLKKAGLIAGISLFILTVVSFTMMHTRIRDIRQKDTAIIMAATVNARSSPDEQSTNVFVLHEGSKVMITDSVQNWKEIRIANGSTGWVPGDALVGI
jgi:tetratricopeptide (TPR) repeat protein